MSLAVPPLFAALQDARGVLVAGAGGGFDVYAGLPLYFALRDAGTPAHLASLSFTKLDRIGLDSWLEPDVAAVVAATSGPRDYFPERTLATWLATTVYAFPRLGVQPLRAAYRVLVEHLGVDTVVLVDGGTDILLRGDESGLGTPEEDMTSLAAVAGLDLRTKLVTSLGFGVDAHFGVNHSEVLENLAALDRDGAYLGALSIPSGSREAELYRQAVEDSHAATPKRPSIVNGQIAAALRGDFGDVQFTKRTAGSRLFVNPLMAVYFTVELDALARHNLYLDRLEDTRTPREVALRIEAFRETVTRRVARAFPH